MKKYLWLAVVALPALPMQAHAQHDHDEHGIEEVIVSGVMDKRKADTVVPVNVLSGEELRENAAKTLGETLNRQIGVTSASFGPGVGQPVIRGQTGSRVRVLQDGVGALDASLVSQDHANAVEAILAERIEVIRGPATLLYGSGAIGGVVNVIDNRIPEHVPETPAGAFELRHNTVSSGDTGVFKLDGGDGSVAWHLDGLWRETGDVEIPGLAVDVEALEALHEEGAAGDEEVENTDGFIANSGTEAANLTAGASWIGERGFLGASISRLENEYGLPPGAHGHHHEGEATEEGIRIDMQQTRLDLKGGLKMEGFFNRLRARLTVNDYEHAELEGFETGTVFHNEGFEGRLLLDHRHSESLSGVLGLQFAGREFSALGEEAFIPASDIQSWGVFAVESLEKNRWSYEFGLRLDGRNIDMQSGRCEAGETVWSGSAAAIWRFREDSNMLMSLNRSARAATVEELFSNIGRDDCMEPADPEERVLHSATARYEFGNPGLEVETSQNIEIGLRKHAGDVLGELNVFYNKIDGFVFLNDVGEFEETIISRYSQQDATFSGIEGEITFPFELSDTSHVDLTLFADYVRAGFDAGGNVPRIPPMRLGAEASYARQSWILKLRVTSVAEQDEVAENETTTEGYTRMDLYFDYHVPWGQNELLVFVKGNNLTDEEIRNHVSFLKNFTPEPGRGFEAGLRYQF
ncbi:MAG TPA: TonB-dependent receptor [Gammaproteobacteria bacterium]